MTRTIGKIRCAVYTRKSSEEGLEQSFNSLHAQREACEAFVLSQRHEGWSVVAKPYDDGGFSGGTMDRPGLKALLADIEAGEVDVVVVYKIDRLTRSLFDFAKIVEIFDAQKVSFVSVTQSFNTTTSMGRLTLNVLLSFAQFEREVTGERIRDKVAASKKRGMWMGGNIPLGYDLKDRKLVINEDEAATVRTIFKLYVELGAVRKVKSELDRLQLKTKVQKPASGLIKGGLLFRVGHIYTILRNRLYRGEIEHKGQIYAGDHPSIVVPTMWERVYAQLAANAAVRRTGTSSKEPSMLAGLLFDGSGNRMTPSHAVKAGKRYRYYVSNNLIAGADKGRANSTGTGLRLAAQEIENHVTDAIAQLLRDPSRLTAAFCVGASPEAAGAVIGQARALADGVGAARYETVRSIIDKVEVTNVAIRIEISKSRLEALLHIDPTHICSGGPIGLTIAAELRRLGKEKRLIVPAHASPNNPDPVLIKAIVKSHRWFNMLRDGEVESISDLARAEEVQRTYPSRIIPLAFLAPDITEAILDGRQPIDLSLDRLLETMPLPLAWDAQRKMLGFPAR